MYSVHSLSPESDKTFVIVITAGLLTFPLSEAFPSRLRRDSGLDFQKGYDVLNAKGFTATGIVPDFRRIPF